MAFLTSKKKKAAQAGKKVRISQDQEEPSSSTSAKASHNNKTKNNNNTNDTMPLNQSSSNHHSTILSASSSVSPLRKTLRYTQVIGSKSTLVLSPDQRSIMLSPTSPKPLSGTKALLQDSTTTSPIFRQDVRQEWIDAIFGKDFFPSSSSSSSSGNDGDNAESMMDAMEYTPPREGMGLAKIPSYLSYTVTIVNPDKQSSSHNKNDKENGGSAVDKDTSMGKKVGVTLSRIPIGVYARMVDLESEAYAAGVVPGSILVDINGMGVLGEPSHKLLERLWIYEGHFRNIQDKEEMKNSHSNSNSGGRDGLNLVEEKENGKKKGGSGIGRKNLTPVIMTWIKDGQLYTTVFMAGTPFGISWAPCGNFALIQRAYSFAQKAGVRRGCIVAAVNHKSIRDMDHLDTAIELKEQFSKGRDIRIVCIYTPAASRTNHFMNKSMNGNVMKSIANDFKSIDGVKVRKADPLKRQPHQQQVVEHPTEYGVGSFFTCGTGANYTPVTSGTVDDLISDLANSVAAGEIAAPTGMKVGLSNLGRNSNAVKTSFEQILAQRLLADEHALSRSLRELERKYDDFPTISWSDIIAQWNFLDAITFCTRMHAAAYNDDNFMFMGGVIGVSDGQSSLWVTKNSPVPQIIPLHSNAGNIGLLKAVRSFPHAPEIIQSYLLQMIAFISSDQSCSSFEFDFDGAKEEKSASEIIKAAANQLRKEMIEVIVEIALHDDDLCQTLHFLLRSFSSTYAKLKLSPGFETLNSAHQYLKRRLLEVESSESILPALYSPGSVSYDESYDYGSLISPSSTIQQETFDSSSSTYASKKPFGKKFGKKMAKIFRNRNFNNIGEESEVSLSIAASETVEVDSISSSLEQMGYKKKLGFMPTSILRKAVDQTPQDGRFCALAVTELPSTPEIFENMGWFLSNLDELCGNIERSLLKSFSQKITNWALQPWSDSKHRALAESTTEMRYRLRELNIKDDFDNKRRHWSPVLNPMDATEILVSILPEDSYILPSAHFPLLLAFDSRPNPRHHVAIKDPSTRQTEKLHRVQVKVVSAQGGQRGNENSCYLVYAALGGTIKNTGRSKLEPYYGSTTHRWHVENELEFESRLADFPRTLEIKVYSTTGDSFGVDESKAPEEKGMHTSTEIGFAFVDLSDGWNIDEPRMTRHSVDVFANTSTVNFDPSGNLIEGESLMSKVLSVELEIVTESFPLLHARDTGVDSALTQRRMLLYKHDEDMRQEMLAIQYLDTCDRILKASGLDLKMKKYKCLSVGENKGFVEWVPGAVSLSEICKAVGKDSSGPTNDQKRNATADVGIDDEPTKFVRTGAWCKHESLRDLRSDAVGLTGYNPIQDFLRSNAYDPDGPYFIHKDTMDNYVKSCAGYCVITYLLGVGDRHTDNLLLHPEGHFLHCDFSFILGRDPKTFLPMRITQNMVNGMGGRESDNFAKFLSLAGAAFVTLRQPASVRILMSLIQGMLHSNISDISVNQNPDEALKFAHERFCLDLNDDDAVVFLEENIERSLSSKLWLAVDAIHSIGKRF